MDTRVTALHFLLDIAAMLISAGPLAVARGEQLGLLASLAHNIAALIVSASLLAVAAVLQYLAHEVAE